MPKASVIILTYSHADNIPAILDALSGDDVEIIIAQDGLGRFIPIDYGRVKVYDHARTQPWQASKARNGGARLAVTPYLLFLDDDHLPLPGWVDAHLQTLADHDISIGLYDPEVVANLPGADAPRQELVDEGRGMIWQMTYTGNLGMRAQAWRDVGGFDERYGGAYGHEDTDFGWMCYHADARFAFSPEAKVKRYADDDHPKSEAQVKPNLDRFVSKVKDAMRILIIYPGHEFSTYEVARGYTAALRHSGHVVETFLYHQVFAFCGKAITANHGHENTDMALALASRQIAPAVLDFVPDVVLNVCGMALMPQAWEYVWRLGVPMVTILTESPYQDANQAQFLDHGHALACLVNDRASLELMRGICRAEYLPHSYDPNYHYPRPPRDDIAPSDVVFVGSMYLERERLFQAINWDGINLKLVGSAVQFLADGAAKVTNGISNELAIEHYRASKIGLTLHRTSQGVDPADSGWRLNQIQNGEAYSLGPRTYEQAACGLFQISDDQRPELFEVFADSIPTFRNPADAERLIRHYLRDDVERQALAVAQRERVKDCTFLNRAQGIVIPLLKEVKGYGSYRNW